MSTCTFKRTLCPTLYKARCAPCRHVKARAQTPTIHTPSGSSIQLEPPNFSLTIGSSDECDVTIKATAIEATHAEILHRPQGRMYCRVLAGKSEDFLSASTAVWLEETELRSGVDYMLSPGAKLSFGEKGDNVIRIDFDEGAEGGGMAQMMMNVMAQGASDQVRGRLSN